ncbi:MAG: hypothetical protein ABJC10_02660 [Acidobacteriota bacterium]
MKICPQCDFIYEDDQRFCDMEGKELVHGSNPVVTEAEVSAELGGTPKQRTSRRPRSIAIAVVFGLVITALVIAAIIVRTHQTRSRAARTSTQAPNQSIAQSPAQFTSETAAQPLPTESSITQTPAANSVQTDQLESRSYEPSAAQSRALSHSPLTANSVTTRDPSASGRGSVIVRLSNGAAIKADEAWEKKEGVWYRQAGVVTFLKRNRVRTIERIAAPVSPPKSPANRPENTGRRQNGPTHDQLRLIRLEPVESKKQSRVTSFLKKTGQILKKPFKF